MSKKEKKKIKKEDMEVIDNLDMLLDMDNLQEKKSWDEFIDILLQDNQKFEEEMV